MSKTSLTLTQELKDVIALSGDWLSIADIKPMLEHRMDADSSTISALVSQLTAKGHLERQEVAGQRNRYRIAPGAKSKAKPVVADRPKPPIDNPADVKETATAAPVTEPTPAVEAESDAVVNDLVEAPSSPTPDAATGMNSQAAGVVLKNATLHSVNLEIGAIPSAVFHGSISIDPLDEGMKKLLDAGQPSYDPFEHIDAALTDLEDLASDLVNRAEAPEVVMGVLAAQGSLRRAQTALYRALKAR